MAYNYIKYFTDITLADSPQVGGKNASLGQMIQNISGKDIKIPLGFALTTDAYWAYLKYNNLIEPIEKELALLRDVNDVTLLRRVGHSIRTLIVEKTFPRDIADEIIQAYGWLCDYYNQANISVAIRSSATAEDLPHASFAGQQETYLNIEGTNNVIEACKKCLASLFTDRALAYRIEKKYDHFAVALSVGVQKMVRSDKASAGIIFTLDTESGFKDIITITSAYGLGETVVKGLITPDEFHVHKPTLKLGFRSIIKKYRGSKSEKLVYNIKKNSNTTISEPVAEQERDQFSLNDNEIITLAQQALIIEEYYTQLHSKWSPMDIEWAKDGIDQELYIVQARPETVQAHKSPEVLTRYYFKHKEKPEIILQGQSIGNQIAQGKVCILQSMQEHTKFNAGDILVAQMTDPDWVPLMKKAAAIITDSGGRTCHAAIVSRELGIPALVGTHNATQMLTDGQQVSVDCSQGSTGYVYKGLLEFYTQTIELTEIPQAPVPLFLNIADPERAYELSFLPVSGVGLARLEFIITNFIKVHPLAICHLEQLQDKIVQQKIKKLASAYKTPQEFYIDTLAQGIATIAAGFYPHPVVVRLADFKSNEYRNLLGGEIFEPLEENPMIGFRGAIRFSSAHYAPAFALECAALKKAREHMGLLNIKIMIPFVRTVAEAQDTLTALADNGLKKGQDNLEILMMCEVPSNILLLTEFAQFFTSFSIGSNDLTQLVLGVDRDSALLAPLFDERNPAVKKIVTMALETAREQKLFLSVCGEAPSDFPEFGDFLIKHGINALSLNPDSVIPFLMHYKHKN